MKIHGTAKGGALSTKDFGVAFGGAPAGCTGGDDILINTDGSRDTDNWVGAIVVQKVTGVADTCYNKIAIDIVQADGNGRLGAYTDDSGVPKELLAQTDSFVVTADYNFRDITEFTIPTNDFWIAFQLSSLLAFTRGQNPFGNGFSWMVFTPFAPFANPYGTTLYSGSVGISCKVGHS